MLKEKPLSPWWRHATILVMIVGFTVLGIITALAYSNAPPIPSKVVSESGKVLFTAADIEAGQDVFLKYDLMEEGTLWGHGAYLGPDYTAKNLHQIGKTVRDALAMEKFGRSFADLSPAETVYISEAAKKDLKKNRYDSKSGYLVLSKAEEKAFGETGDYWMAYFTGKNGPPGLSKDFIKGPKDIEHLSDYFAWATWATVANRPGKNYTYTNNWPYDPSVGNHPSGQAYIWSALSVLVLLAGLGLILLIFGKYGFLGWKGSATSSDEPEPPIESWKLTPSQWATGKYFLIVAVLFLLQSLAGGALAHYKVEPHTFYGLDFITRVLPFNLLRTFHLQLAIFWISVAWVAGGLFLAPWVGGGEPKHQKLGVNVLFVALLIVSLGSMAGEYLGVHNMLGNLWFWFGDQGSEYLDLGRFWQVLLAAGLIFWLFLMFRALRPAIRKEGRSALSALFLYAAVAIPVFYLPALFYGPHTNFAVIDNWRFWIIHLWVEGFFELFATVLVAIMFRRMGLVTTRNATRLVYLDAILFLTGGIIGTGHHWYFTGQGVLNMGLASCFSALEVVPLTLLTLDAFDFIRLPRKKDNGGLEGVALKQKWSIYFLIAVGVWNFVGAGLFGFLINMPIVSYFEMGTTLTLNHGHAAMFGVFGMLALAVLVFCLRAMQSDEVWVKTQKLVKLGFWGLNVGLALMVVTDLFPAGVLQLWDVLTNGYWHARSLAFTMSGTFHDLEWIRIGPDLIFIILGVIPITLAAIRSFIKRDLKPFS